MTRATRDMTAAYPSEPLLDDRITADNRVPTADDRISERGVGELVGDVARDMSALLRQEVELAKAEARTEAKKAGKAAGMFGGAGFAGYMVALWSTVTIAAALAIAIPVVYAALAVTALWGALGALLALRGRRELRRMQGLPKTQQTLKEDAAWVRHPGAESRHRTYPRGADRGRRRPGGEGRPASGRPSHVEPGAVTAGLREGQHHGHGRGPARVRR